MRFDKKEYRLLIGFSAVFLLFLGLNLYFNYATLKSNIKRYEDELFSRVAGKIESWNAANFKNVDKIASLLQTESLSSKAELNALLEKLQKGSNFPYLILGLDDGSFYISDPTYITPRGYDLKSRAWYNDTLNKGHTIVSKPYISMRLGLRSVSICTPVRVMGEAGVFCGGQPFEVIRKYFAEYQTLYNKSLYLINNDGEILASFGVLNETIKFENKDSQRYAFFGIKGTDWSVVFEKDEQIYSKELGRLVLTNLLLYALCIGIYLFSNFFWLRQQKASKTRLNEQSSYITDVLTKRLNTAMINCDSELNITSKSPEFTGFYGLDGVNLKTSILASQNLSEEEKQKFLSELELSAKSPEMRYFDITLADRGYLVTSAPLSSMAPFAISLSFCDVSHMKARGDKNSGEPSPQLEKLLVFALKNLGDESLCAQKLAKATGYSRFYLQRIFKDYADETLANFLRSQRLLKACWLLKFSQLKISEIGTKCGFSHTETFIRSFIKAHGISPLKYRQSYTPTTLKLSYTVLSLPNLSLSLSLKPTLTSKFALLLHGTSFLLYASEASSDEASLSLAASKWAKVDVKSSGLSPEVCFEALSNELYKDSLADEIFFSYFSLDINSQIDFLYFKI